MQKHNDTDNVEVIIVCDNPLLCWFLSNFIEKNGQTSCKSYRADEFVAKLETLSSKPAKTITLIDYMIPNVTAIIKKISKTLDMESFCSALFNVPQDKAIEKNILLWGVKGIFHEHEKPEIMKKGIPLIILGEFWFSRETLINHVKGIKNSTLESGKNSDILTKREREILRMVSSGDSNEEIAEKLEISPHTVKNHVSNIYRKIGVPNRTHAAVWASRNLD